MLQNFKRNMYREYLQHREFLLKIYWSNDIFVLKCLKFELYFTFFLPSRLLTLTPDWTFFFLPMVWFSFWRDNLFATYFCLFLCVVLIENSVLFVVYHYLEGGAHFIDRFFYEKKYTRFFFGNPGSSAFRKCVLGVSGIFLFKLGSASNEIIDQHVQAQNFTVQHETALRALDLYVQNHQKMHGENLTSEQTHRLYNMMMEQLKVKGVVGHIDVDILSDSIKASGQVVHKGHQGSFAASGVNSS